MKRILYFVTLAALTLAAAASCSKNVEWDEITPSDGQPGISLSFTNPSMTTKAVAGINRENYVERIEFFVFPLTEVTEGEGENQTTKYIVADDAEYVFSGSYSGTAAEGWTHTAGSGDNPEKWVYSKTMTADELNELFPDGASKARVFAVANYCEYDETTKAPKITSIPSDKKTWAELRALPVGSTFTEDGGKGFGLRWPRVKWPIDREITTTGEGETPVTTTKKSDLFFVMTCEEDITLNKNDISKAECGLARLASKVTVDLTYENCPETKENQTTHQKTYINWVPETMLTDAQKAALPKLETRVYLSNAICNSNLGAPLSGQLHPDGGTETEPWADRDIFEYAYDFLSSFPADVKPFYYTYPLSMEEGDDNQPYLKLVLPWYGYKYVGAATETEPTYSPGSPDWVFYKQKEVYYKIVLPRETIKDPNYIYNFKVNVNIMGSDKEVKIIGEEYVVLDWTTKNEVLSNVATGRYISLEIPKDHYDMYVDKIDINFVSSGTVIAQIDEIYQMDLGGTTPTPQYFMQSDVVVASDDLKAKKGGLTNEQIEGWVTIPDGTSHLTINHSMDNRLKINNSKNEAFDMSPYEYRVTLHLEEAGEDTAFDRTITITQYPSMYVTSKKSNGVVWVNAYTYGRRADGTSMSTFNDSNNVSASYAYDSRGTNNNSYQIGSVSNETALSTTANNNGYNMIIHPTILDPSLKMNDDTAYMLGDARVSTGGTMANITGPTRYKQTRNDIKGIVSPGFLIASSYGKTQPMSIDQARKRCASYQENGYPAGRWRIPSPGEIEYLVTLSNNGFIPSLFEGDYWASNGNYFTSTNNTWNSGGTHAVRCVYDVWYWGEEPYEEGATEWLGFKD